MKNFMLGVIVAGLLYCKGSSDFSPAKPKDVLSFTRHETYSVRTHPIYKRVEFNGNVYDLIDKFDSENDVGFEVIKVDGKTYWNAPFNPHVFVDRPEWFTDSEGNHLDEVVVEQLRRMTSPSKPVQPIKLEDNF